MHHPARALAAILVAAVAVTLSGCAASTETDPPADAVEVTTDPTTEPTEPAEPEVPVPANGETLTTQEQIDAAKAAGLDAYELTDGTVIAVDPTQPLPQPVIDEAIVTVQAEYSPVEGNPYGLDAAAQSIDNKTTKNVVIIYPMHASKDGITWEPLYRIDPIYRDQMSGYPGSQRDPQVLVAFAEAWIAQQDDPETYQIIVVPVP